MNILGVLIATAIPIITILRKKLVESGLILQTQNCKTSPISLKRAHILLILYNPDGPFYTKRDSRKKSFCIEYIDFSHRPVCFLASYSSLILCTLYTPSIENFLYLQLLTLRLIYFSNPNLFLVNLLFSQHIYHLSNTSGHFYEKDG